MSDPKYDLVPENLGPIQSLVMQLANELIALNPNLSRGRAILRAQDNLAEKLIVPPTTGEELGHWLGVQMNIARHGNREAEATVTKNGFLLDLEPVLEEAPSVVAKADTGIAIRQPHMDTDTFPVQRQRRMDLIQKLSAKMKPIQVGQVWAFPISSEDEAKYLKRLFTIAARLLGWKAPGGRGKSFQLQILDDKIKIKRLG